jgi:hypothetical protein
MQPPSFGQDDEDYVRLVNAEAEGIARGAHYVERAAQPRALDGPRCGWVGLKKTTSPGDH